jgi:uncharacterized protein YbaP (TraB family)
MYELSAQSSMDHPELEAQLNRLLDDRNVAMVKKIDSYMATDDTYFVVVGALHMGGPRGILRLLARIMISCNCIIPLSNVYSEYKTLTTMI